MNLIPPIPTNPVAPLPGNGLEPGDNPLASVEGPIFYDELIAALARGAGEEGGASLADSPGDSALSEGESPQNDLQGLPAEVTSQLVDQANFSPAAVTGVVSTAHDLSSTTADSATKAVAAAPAEVPAVVDTKVAIDRVTPPQPAERNNVPQDPVLASDLPTESLVVTSGAEGRLANTTQTAPQVAKPQESLTAIPKGIASVMPKESKVLQPSTPDSDGSKAVMTTSATSESSTIPDLISKPTLEASSVDRQASAEKLSSTEVSVSPSTLMVNKTASLAATSMQGSSTVGVENQRTAQSVSQIESSIENSSTPLIEQAEVELASATRPVSPESREAAVSIAASTVSSDTTRVLVRASKEIPSQVDTLTAADLDLIDPVSSSVQRVTSVNLETPDSVTDKSGLNEALIENNATQWRFDMRSSAPVSASADFSNQNDSGTQANGSTIGNAMVSETSGSATAAEKFVSTLLGMASSSQPASAADRTISELKQSTTIVSAPHMARWDAAAVQVELVRMIKDGGGQVVMKLTPPDEGSFKIDLSLDSDRSVRIFVEGASDSVRTRLEQGAEQLREQFSQMGFNLQLDMHSRREASGQSAGFGFADPSDLSDSGGGLNAAAEAGNEVEVSPAARRRSMIDESRVYFRA